MRFKNLFLSRLWIAVMVSMGSSSVLADGVEAEPNQPCEAAQTFSAAYLPFAVEGELFPSPDVDFFQFERTPGEALRVDLEGSSTGKGTLPDPYLGLFNQDCNLISIDDDGGVALNSRIYVSVPAEGRFIIGVTSCCDSAFSGGGEGSYLLTISTVEPIGSISGRVIDEEETPLSGVDFPYSSVYLLRSGDYGLDWTGISAQPDEFGEFGFSGSNPLFPPLEAGSYALWVSAIGYTTVLTDPFEVGPGQDFDIGDLVLTRIRFIGSISGQLLDSVSGEPITGDPLLYAWVELMNCDEWNNCYYTVGQSPDAEGRFSFDGGLFGLQAGNYRVRAVASQYNWGESSIFSVAEEEAFDVGGLPLVPFPLQLRLLETCPNPSTLGGTCKFTLGIRNASGQRVSGQLWSLVWASLPSSSTYFQIGKNGATNPMPQKYNLRAGASAQVQFEFYVPPSFPDGWYACTTTILGQDPNPLFNTQAETPQFCVVKGIEGYTVTSEKETRRLYQELRKRGRN